MPSRNTPIPDYVDEPPLGSSSPPAMPVVKESVGLWACLMVLAVEAPVLYFLDFATKAFVVIAALDVVLLGAARIRALLKKA